MTFLLAQIKLKNGPGVFQEYLAAFAEIEALHEPITGWKLHYRLHAPNGDRGEVWHLWETGPEPESRQQGRAAFLSNPTLVTIMARARDCFESEVLHELELVAT